MEDEKPIGLAELIHKVKQELLASDIQQRDSALLFSVDEVELELQVIVKKEAKAGVAIYVVELGAGAGRDDMQRIKIKLTPLLSKEERISFYKKQNPENWESLVARVTQATFKDAGANSQLDDLYGS
jgi:hypothetical protein